MLFDHFLTHSYRTNPSFQLSSLPTSSHPMASLSLWSNPSPRMLLSMVEEVDRSLRKEFLRRARFQLLVLIIKRTTVRTLQRTVLMKGLPLRSSGWDQMESPTHIYRVKKSNNRNRAKASASKINYQLQEVRNGIPINLTLSISSLVITVTLVNGSYPHSRRQIQLRIKQVILRLNGLAPVLFLKPICLSLRTRRHTLILSTMGINYYRSIIVTR